MLPPSQRYLKHQFKTRRLYHGRSLISFDFSTGFLRHSASTTNRSLSGPIPIGDRKSAITIDFVCTDLDITLHNQPVHNGNVYECGTSRTSGSRFPATRSNHSVHCRDNEWHFLDAIADTTASTTAAVPAIHIQCTDDSGRLHNSGTAQTVFDRRHTNGRCILFGRTCQSSISAPAILP